MKKKRILITFAGVPFIKGGAEVCVESLYNQLKYRGYQVETINLPFQWEPKSELIKNMVMWRLLQLNQIAGTLVDLVIATKFPSYMIKHPNKVTWLFHQHRAIYDLYGTPYSDFNPNDPNDIIIRNQIIAADNKTLAESKSIFTIADNTTKRLKYFNKLDARTLYHPPKHYGRYYCEQYGDYILSVGRLEGLKRVELLIKAMQYTDKQVKCLIAGTGGLASYLKNLVVELKLDNRVKLLGFVEDEELLKLYARCFAVFFAPYDEDYGYITLESFLSKKPVITCRDSGGVMEFAEHGINSLVAETPEPEVFGEYINRFYANRTLSKEYGQNGFDKVKNINWDYVIDHLTSTL
ncbi:glycosyltransferase family 4 protein [Syntrophomonas palmitatica]|uniref:glycosyltransferase family 4 protein n=1 Tax=Syntrophomonas palmitatica TaxID=402877 RepID=UPI0006D18791|nr:glycosyltransferase family 4 protein [Syntrophomonas palmitatica]